MKRLKKVCLFICTLIACIGIIGCSKKEETKKIRDLDYTICITEDLPQELLDIINSKKETVFKITYSDSSSEKTPEFLYIVLGMGEQPTGGYSLSVKELYEGKNAVYFKYGFMGPSKTDKVSEGVSYPYIVVKLEYTDKPVVFR